MKNVRLVKAVLEIFLGFDKLLKIHKQRDPKLKLKRFLLLVFKTRILCVALAAPQFLL